MASLGAAAAAVVRTPQQRATHSETIVTLLLLSQSLSHPLLQRVCRSPSELSGKKRWKKEPNLRNSVVNHNQWQEQQRQKNSADSFDKSDTYFLLRSLLLPQLIEPSFYQVITLLLYCRVRFPHAKLYQMAVIKVNISCFWLQDDTKS